MTERHHFHFSISCIGEGNGNPFQCSCLENPRDGGAWWAAVSWVAQSWTWLKRLSSSSTVWWFSKCGLQTVRSPWDPFGDLQKGNYFYNTKRLFTFCSVLIFALKVHSHGLPKSLVLYCKQGNGSKLLIWLILISWTHFSNILCDKKANSHPAPVLYTKVWLIDFSMIEGIPRYDGWFPGKPPFGCLVVD